MRVPGMGVTIFGTLGITRIRTRAAAVSGSGDIEVSVSNSIEAFISGSGNIEYRGNAQVTKITVHGSGRVSKKS